MIQRDSADDELLDDELLDDELLDDDLAEDDEDDTEARDELDIIEDDDEPAELDTMDDDDETEEADETELAVLLFEPDDPPLQPATNAPAIVIAKHSDNFIR